VNAFAKVDRRTFLRFAAEHPEQRLELERGRIVQQMTGGTRRHGMIAMRIARQLEDQLDAKQWSVTLDRGVSVGSSSRYPDVVVEPSGEPLDSLDTERPVLVVEVLSPSSVATDLNTKPAEYLRIPALDAYLVFSQDEAAVLTWVRDAEGRFPADGQEVSGVDKTIVVSGRGLQLTLRLGDIYSDIVS
jgi:Uma2 family endonuclease